MISSVLLQYTNIFSLFEQMLVIGSFEGLKIHSNMCCFNFLLKRATEVTTLQLLSNLLQ